MMDRERWERVKRVLQAALDRPPEDRTVFLRETCGDDHDLHTEVESLLAAHAEAGNFAQRPAIERLNASTGAAVIEQTSFAGCRIGDYDILACLGTGGMGEVYRARDTKLGRDVALKILPVWTTDPDRLARFEREARMLAALNHPHICTVHDFGRDGDLEYIVMEYIEGETLAARLQRGPLSLDDAFRHASEIADALAAAHARGVIHRDIKPANVMITADGRVKVLDFGLAKVVSPIATADGRPAAFTTATDNTGVALGTVTYMSPEQAEGSSVDARSDVFSFGAVFYEMLTGRPPFVGDSPLATLAAILKDVPAPLKPARRRLPADVVQLVEACLEKNREMRPAADVIVQRLTAIRARSSTPHVHLGMLFSRRAFAVSALLVVLAVAMGAWWTAPDRARAPASGPEKISIAVLPFRTTAVSDSMRFLGVGIPDAIINQLAGVPNLMTRPTSAILRFENNSTDAQQAGRTLVSDYVLTGILQEADNRLAVSVQLVRTQNGAAVWGKRYDVVRSDLLSLQGQIAQSVAEALEIQLSAAERERLFRRYTVNARAYELYLRGRTQLTRDTPQDVRAAIGLFENVLTLDPDYTPAQAGIALGSALMNQGLAPLSEIGIWRERAGREARAALRRDPQLAEAHEALAAVYRSTETDWDRTIEESRRAVALNPNLDRPHFFMAAAFHHLGLLDLVESEVRTGIAVNPTANASFDRGWAKLMAGQYEEALPLLEEWNRQQGGKRYWIMGMGYHYAGESARAEEILLPSRGNSPVDRKAQAVLASLFAARGADTDARTLIKTIVDSHYVDHHLAYSLGTAYAQLAEFADARRWLAQAARTGFPCYPWYAKDPLLDPLRRDPEFQRFLAALQSSWRAQAARYGSAVN